MKDRNDIPSKMYTKMCENRSFMYSINKLVITEICSFLNALKNIFIVYLAWVLKLHQRLIVILHFRS